MSDHIDWDSIRVANLRDAIRQACILEATAPKAGNVHPAASFKDLNYEHFVVAANITAEELVRTELSIAQRMRRAVLKTRATTGTNVNLGIVLLLGPLVDNRLWNDGAIIFDCIRLAGAGGLETVDSMDVHQSTGPVDLKAAMVLAADRDDIAKQYATEFSDLLENLVPVVRESISHATDTLAGIATAHLRILASRPDSLIARKNGNAIAQDVMSRAAVAFAGDDDDRRQFDAHLRSDAHRLNPGTTADLIAASLFILLREKIESQ